jgi:hypothetical protein
MTKLLKHSVLALALALGTSTYAHAETVTAYGGIGGIIQDIIEWLFHGSSGNHNQGNPNQGNPKPNVAPEVDPGLAMSGFMLLGGTLTVLRSRRPRRPAIN